MKLSGQKVEELMNAILEAYPNVNELEQMVRIGLDENLFDIVEKNKNRDIVFKLILWAESERKIKKLIEAAHRYNTNHPVLKEFYDNFCEKPNSSVFKIMGVPEDNFRAITLTEWDKLCSILKEINNDQLITQICLQTLKNSQDDPSANHPELLSNINLEKLKEILLDKSPRRNDNVPTVLEFAERLSNKIEEQLSTQLEEWIETIVRRLDIKLPIYSENSRSSSEDNIYYYLLITAIPEGRNLFKLESELQLYSTLKDSYQPVLEFERNSIECDFEEIPQKAYDLAASSERHNKLSSHPITIELFLPCKYLGYPFDIKEIIEDKNKKFSNYLGCENPLLVSPYDRFDEGNPHFYKEFERRWDNKVQEKLLCKFVDLTKYIRVLKKYDYNCSTKLVNNWKCDEIIGLKIIGCWNKTEKIQESLFDSIVRSGIPLALWIRDDKIPDCEENFNNLLLLESWRDLPEQVFKYRLQAYQDRQKIGYHLGILFNDPQRIPSNLKRLIETGK